MASKGPKAEGTKPAAATPAARAKKPAAPKPPVAAAGAEKKTPEPKVEVAVEPAPVPPSPPEQVASPEAAPQEVVETVAEQPVAAAPAATASARKEIFTMETTMEKNVEKAQAFFADMNDRAKAAVEKSTKMVEEMNDFAKGNVEALVESGRITAKGLETLGQEAAEYGRKSFEEATAALKNMASVKSPAEFFKLQSDFVRSTFDSLVAESSKNTEAMLKLAGDVTQPLSSRFAAAVEKAKKAA